MTVRLRLGTLKFDYFTKVIGLKYLSLKNNDIRVIEGNVFENLDQLTEIDLSNNPITNLENNSLLFLPNELSIDLSDSDINEDILSKSNIEGNNGKLTVYLSNDKIGKLSRPQFEKYTNKGWKIHLDGNELNCDWETVGWILENIALKQFLIKAQCGGRYNNRENFSFNSLQQTQ